ncbi:hypothetical protein BAPNAU_1333 [Bacillus velezensis NAU-B3]|nr:hypothetical protein BAPNAU_1333 [Bacillus velezensis NAU-B3]
MSSMDSNTVVAVCALLSVVIQIGTIFAAGKWKKE